MTLGVDYAWKHPDPSAIKAAGYDFVLRYLSTDASKNLSVNEAAALHKAGLDIGLVWETTSTRATDGFQAGHDDRLAAERQAAALRYPATSVIYWACDEQASPSAVMEYARGWATAAKGRPTGPYGDDAVIEAVYHAGYSQSQWQTEAWSGTAVSSLADLYQRVKPTRPTIAGAAGEYDEDILLHPVALWRAAASAPSNTPPQTAPAPAPAPKPGGWWTNLRKYFWWFGK